MHQALFSLKRAHHASLAMSRRPLRCYGLTAARFDLMYALRRGPRCQRLLARLLGVTAATVSRMVKSLEALGYVARKRDVWDGRRKMVSMTDEGRERFDAALHNLVRRKAVRLALYTAFASGEFLRSQRRRARIAISQLLQLLDPIRSTFGDRAKLRYHCLRVPVPVPMPRPVPRPVPATGAGVAGARGRMNAR